MGSIQCCDVREESIPEYPLIKRQKLHLEVIYQIAPEAQIKYKELVLKHNKDQFLEVPSSYVGNVEIEYIQGYTFIPNINAYYDGQWNLENKPEGRGRIIFKNGSLLVGKFKQFKCNYETCHYFFKDGSYYFGAIKDNRLSGKGKFVNKTLEYEGQWENNLPDGKGEEFMSNGDRYTGTFNKGKKHGTKCNYKWLYHKMFTEYEGGFEGGLIRGNGTLTLKNGCKLTGFFQGQTIENVTLKSLICKYTGSIAKGKFEGKGTLQITPRNQVFEGNYREGQLYGLCIHVDSKGRRNQCFIFKKKKLAKIVGLKDEEIQTVIKCIDEVYSTNDSHEQALECNSFITKSQICDLTDNFSVS